jgi:hypothetical protein
MTHIKVVRLKEELLREIAKDWLAEQFSSYRKHMEFKIFHGKGPLTKHLKNKFWGTDLTSVPNYETANVEPDIAGILVSATTDKKLWVIAEVKANEQSVSQADRRQAIDYAKATTAFRAFLISDGPLGNDIREDIKNGMHSYNGMFESGQKGICYVEFFRYLERTAQFVRNK